MNTAGAVHVIIRGVVGSKLQINIHAVAETEADDSGTSFAGVDSPAIDSVFAFKAAKYVFIAFAVNCSPVTIGYFCFGP